MSTDAHLTPTPGVTCWECPIRDGELICNPSVSLRCSKLAQAYRDGYLTGYGDRDENRDSKYGGF